MQEYEQVISHEIGQFQNRIQRCVMSCQDSIKDKYPSLEQNSPQVAKAEKDMMVCANSCVDKHLILLKTMSTKFTTDLDKINAGTGR